MPDLPIVCSPLAAGMPEAFTSPAASGARIRYEGPIGASRWHLTFELSFNLNCEHLLVHFSRLVLEAASEPSNSRNQSGNHASSLVLPEHYTDGNTSTESSARGIFMTLSGP